MSVFVHSYDFDQSFFFTSVKKQKRKENPPLETIVISDLKLPELSEQQGDFLLHLSCMHLSQ